MRNLVRILVDSNFVKTELLDYFGIKPEKVIVHHLAADNIYRQRTELEVYKTLNKFGLKFKKFILCVGTLEPRKNLTQAISAYRNLPSVIQDQYPLVVVGAKGWKSSQLESDLGALVNKGKAHLLGYVDQQTLADIFSSAKILLYPSLYEGFGLPPLEAMTSGVPVIVTNTASLPEVVGDAGIKVEIGDIQNTRSVLEEVLDNHEYYKSTM